MSKNECLTMNKQTSSLDKKNNDCGKVDSSNKVD